VFGVYGIKAGQEINLSNVLNESLLTVNISVMSLIMSVFCNVPFNRKSCSLILKHVRAKVGVILDLMCQSGL